MAAKKVCFTCPVKTPCLEWALEVDDRYAVLGGTTPVERGVMLGRKREMARQVCSHGHRFTPLTVRVSASGRRKCLTCQDVLTAKRADERLGREG